jgi:hypothetical protein
MKKTHWKDRVINEVLTKVEERNNLPAKEQRKAG